MRRPRMLAAMERTSALDGVDAALQRAVGAATRRRRVRDLLHGVWLGHPLHPALVQLPLGAWMSAAVLDAVPGQRRAATMLIGTGVAAAIPAAAAGATDWSAQASEQRRVGLVHAAANTAALSLYVASLLARRRGRHGAGRALAYLGLGAAGAGAFLGGDLSFRQAAGVNHAAPELRQLAEEWQEIALLAELPDGKPAVRRAGDVSVLVYRRGAEATVLLERCAHQGGPLGEGEVVDERGEACVVCPWHGSVFRLADGGVVHGPAASDQPSLPSRVVDGRVEVRLP